MNQFKNGTLLVVVATAITALLILMTDRDSTTPSKEAIAEVTKTESETQAVATEATTEAAPEKTTESEIQTTTPKATEIVKEEKAEESTITKASEETTSTEVQSIAQIAEPNVDENNSSTIQTEPVEIAAPEGPYKKSDTETAEVAKPAEEKPESVTEEAQTSTEEDVQPESINDVATSNQHQLLNHLTQPIWMDQKVGEFKSVDNGDVVFKLMPTNPEGLQGSNPKQVVTKDSDKFAQTTVSADYNYQQMPMYNGGYYIAPMPQYFMESTLPASSPVNSQ